MLYRVVLPVFLLPIFSVAKLPAEPNFVETRPPSLVVVGFMGGFVGRNNAIHQEVRLAEHLRKDLSPSVAVRIFENHSGPVARREILELIDANRDGELSAIEKKNARIILYGHSWGASEVVNTARSLEKEGVKVLLTIQVDSVGKPGEDDRTIPANVAQAVNFYQLDGLLHGCKEIFAQDSARTQILGNFKFDYKRRTSNVAGFPWFARTFMRPHIEIESDPVVWSRVESLIRDQAKALP